MTFSPNLNQLTHTQTTYAPSNKTTSEGINLRYKAMPTDYAREAEIDVRIAFPSE
jgi:hypothetical protein